MTVMLSRGTGSSSGSPTLESRLPPKRSHIFPPVCAVLHGNDQSYLVAGVSLEYSDLMWDFPVVQLSELPTAVEKEGIGPQVS